jgi:hypothetical protein
MVSRLICWHKDLIKLAGNVLIMMSRVEGSKLRIAQSISRKGEKAKKRDSRNDSTFKNQEFGRNESFVPDERRRRRFVEKKDVL